MHINLTRQWGDPGHLQSTLPEQLPVSLVLSQPMVDGEHTVEASVCVLHVNLGLKNIFVHTVEGTVSFKLVYVCFM